MSIASIRTFINGKVIYSTDFHAVTADYQIKDGVAVPGIKVIFSFDAVDNDFKLSHENETRRGTVSIQKSDIEDVKRGDTITHGGNTYMVTGLESSNPLDVIATIQQIKNISVGGLIHE